MSSLQSSRNGHAARADRRATACALASALLGVACSAGGQDALIPLDGSTGALAPDAPAACADAGDAGGASALMPVPVPDPALAGQVHRYFEINVVDAADGLPVAGAQLETTNKAVYTTDAHGVVAFYEPGLMGTSVYFSVSHPSYSIDADQYGNRGAALMTAEGASARIAMNKSNAAASPVEGDLQSRRIAGPVPGVAGCFAIRVIDSATGRGVPLVFVSSADEQYVTDSQGMVAYCNPDHLGRPATFAIASDGYTFAAGSVAATLEAGQGTQIALDRANIAERMYRSTGQGIYRDSVLLGLTTPLDAPVIDGLVMEQDSACAATYEGKLFWVWGNTDRPSYPLGDFDGAGGTSSPPAMGGLDPRLGVNLHYIVGSDGSAQAMAPGIAPTSLPTWLSAPVTVPDANGHDQLYAVYAKPNPDLSLEDSGLLHFDDSRQAFAPIQPTAVHYPLTGSVIPAGQPITFRQPEGTYVYYGVPLRVPAKAEAIVDTTTYQVWSALGASGSTTLQRATDGSLAYAWRSGAAATTPADVSAAGVGLDQALDGHVVDVTTGSAVSIQETGAEAWNDHRKRFVRVVQQIDGASSFLGEVWYAEGDTPMGPWVYARKVLTHSGHTFYAPWMHPYWQEDDGRFVFFEGAYTTALSMGSVPSTPYYERNQIVYRMDLDDDRLALPVAVYDVSGGGRTAFAVKQRLRPSTPPAAAVFFAPDRATSGALPVAWSGPSCDGARELVVGGSQRTFPVFYAAAVSAQAATGLVPLYDFADASGRHAYDVNAKAALPGFTAKSGPIAYVWPGPIAVKLPVADYLGDLLTDAGGDQCLSEIRHGSGADVRLDGSASRSATGSIVSYTWSLQGQPCPAARGATAALHLPAGLYGVRLEVVDVAGNVGDDDAVVEIAAR